MPNWCANEMEVSGPTERVKLFMKEVSGRGPYDREEKNLFDFNKVVPMPEEAISDYENIGYNWQLANWGCKWGASTFSCNIEELSTGSAVAHYVYDTPWAPGNECFFKELSLKYPDLRFFNKYVEPGMAFAGEITAENGNVVDETVEFTREKFPQYFEDDDLIDEEEAETRALEDQGLTRSDAQGVVEARKMNEKIGEIKFILVKS